ncbi:mechanosensitive ion channel family protein [Pseudomonas paeninsulae]|uniref:mechanosensitive ion channel family protein n=1 Tax=Pseudomonas paeninsulae TaxID=3110772 RepID=UPI002D77FA38|nr:mechanosensitive ion channel domain-containing protein [Pseudomonas sp. IT1137]
MIVDELIQLVKNIVYTARTAFSQPEIYTQIGIVLAIYLVAWVFANRIRKYAPFLDASQEEAAAHPLRKVIGKLGSLIFPVLAILMLRISVEVSEGVLNQGWLVQAALTVAILLLFYSVIRDFIQNRVAAGIFKWLGMPLLFLHLLGILSGLIAILESISVNLGNIEISAYGIARVAIFGSLLFWLGRISSKTGRSFIAHQESLDIRTREVAAKLFEVAIFFLISLLILQVMGINLTTLAVFGGAIGVGIGLGLQAIASNFISGIIILLDRSVSIGDYVELDDGRTGMVRELNMRSTTLETFDGKDIVVPNEKFIAEIFTNWTHKDKSQRYRVDFSVAYHSDIRKLVEIIKAVVASHPQVFSGDAVPLEERPDCEIDSFGDSGINMFVEFWMEGIDDGKNRVGGDLLLMILEALQEHGYEIPFPQREIRVVNKDFSINSKPGD